MARRKEKIVLHPVVAEILLRRGFKTEAEIFSFLHPSWEALESPFVFHDMEKAVTRIHRAIQNKEKILVYGDYDVDGVTASAILYPALKKMGAEVDVHIPHRMKEGYGLNLESLKPWIKLKTAVVITVDNGITGIEAVQFLKDNGVDVIVVDHHQPKDTLPPADAILSAAVHDRKGDAGLAACGLAFKLVWALSGDLETAKTYLDLVTLGTVADLAPVTGDNRILLKYGLKAVADSKKVGLRALMDSAMLKPQWLNYRDLAFSLGPRINASGRMGTPLNAFKLLTTDNPVEARNLAQILEQGNRDRQRVELTAYQEAARVVETGLKPEHRELLVVDSADWHEGVLGIVASRLVDRFKKPSLVISVKEGMGKGSGRSTSSFSLLETVSQCEDLLVAFGGHAQACGFTVRQENIAALRERLNRIVREGATPAPQDDATVDAELTPSQLGLDLVKDLEKMAPFGPGNPGPLFLTRKMRVRGEVKKRGKDTLQCWMVDESERVTCEVVGFRHYEKWAQDTKKQSRFDILYRPALKNFNGIETLQLELQGWS